VSTDTGHAALGSSWSWIVMPARYSAPLTAYRGQTPNGGRDASVAVPFGVRPRFPRPQRFRNAPPRLRPHGGRRAATGGDSRPCDGHRG
jgi:hypothetical protein